jgi:hypothetical protein
MWLMCHRPRDRYIRARARHAQAWRPHLWLGTRNRGPLTASGIYQMIARRGRQCGVDVFPYRFGHHFSHTWLDRGSAEGDWRLQGTGSVIAAASLTIRWWSLTQRWGQALSCKVCSTVWRI